MNAAHATIAPSLAQARLLEQDRDYKRDQAGRFSSTGAASKRATAGAAPKSGGDGIAKKPAPVPPPEPKKSKGFGGKEFPKFSGRGVIGTGPLKMKVLSKQQIRDIFRRAGQKAGRQSESRGRLSPVLVHARFVEGGPGSGRRPGGRRSIWAPPERGGEEQRMISKFTMRPEQRARQIKVSPKRAAVIRKALGMTAVRAALISEQTGVPVMPVEATMV